ncbi:MAG TPA: Dabb family protein [Gemmataceae bacterium]|nr:Dabb family protein [Gemmataceae bacterium]
MPRRAADESEAPMATEPLLAHNVYFSLRDRSTESVRQMVEACKKHLAGHPGTLFFAAGTLAQELARPVNDRDFDVALHLVFANQAAHDEYQKSARHQQFIDENRAGWARVRVFDSLVGP